MRRIVPCQRTGQHRAILWLAALLWTGTHADADQPAAARIALGRRLFYDADLSVNGTMSCATCHEQRHGFTDNNRTHPGALDDSGVRNVQGLANVGTLRHLTWADPTLFDLARQARIPLLGNAPPEMAIQGHEAEVVARIAEDACYRRLFAAAFPDGRVNLESITAAIAAFERTLISRDSPFDRAERTGEPLGDPLARVGWTLFRTHGCATCHRQPDFTDDAFHRVRPWSASEHDKGVASVTGRLGDLGAFRTPSLRNVTVTFPYWHDGRADTLAAAIALHDPAWSGIKALSPPETLAITAFLSTLTDKTFLSNPAFALPPAACPAEAEPPARRGQTDAGKSDG